MFLHFFYLINECTAKLCLAQPQQPLGSAPSALVARGHAGLAPCAAGAKSFKQQAGRLHKDYEHTALSHLSAATD